jgi:hypothetical protein
MNPAARFVLFLSGGLTVRGHLAWDMALSQGDKHLVRVKDASFGK